MTYAEKRQEAARRVKLRIIEEERTSVDALKRADSLMLMLCMIETHVMRIDEDMLDKVLAVYTEDGQYVPL